MRRPNGAVLWLLGAGFAMGLSLPLVASFFLGVYYLIPSFIIMVIAAYIVARMIGRAGGEFSSKAGNMSILLEGFIIGLVFDMFRIKFDWVINIFKSIAIGSMFILMAMVLKRNYEHYSEKQADGPYPLFMRTSILYILAGVNFALVFSSLSAAFLLSLYFVPLLVLVITGAIFSAIFSKPDYDLLDSESGAWTQLFTGLTVGFAYDMVMFRAIYWMDLLQLAIVSMTFALVAYVIRLKETTVVSSKGVQIELAEKKSRKRTSRVASQATLRKKTSRSKSRSKSSSKKRRR